ncbi:High mobility group superfamily [Penicillium bovifimosum]|uniref:High mobility group superfamily n=1 Tax=Penicillium bovifimosum TaxID=126998 RepID=A0A9W9GP98_9EURO|nr:High mobility group superfamily [Penicillium bovifimosum]KAJ5124622.1 High mobility group superfamily [Penicillium bovifimosum]
MFTSPLTNDPKDMPPGRCLEILWCEAMQNIEAAKGQILVPNNIVQNALGMDNLEEMYRRLRNMNNGTAYMHFDESLGAWCLSTTDKYRNERTPALELKARS